MVFRPVSGESRNIELPDGATVAMLNAALVIAKDSGGGMVRLPPAGISGIDTPIVLHPECRLEGYGWNYTYLTAAASYTGNIIENAAPTGGETFTRRLSVADVSLVGDAYGGKGIYFLDAAEIMISNVGVTKCSYGMDFETVITGEVRMPKINDNGVGMRQKDNCNAIATFAGRIQSSKNENVILDGPSSFAPQFYGTVIESSGMTTSSAGVLIGANDGEIHGVLLSGCYFEANRTGLANSLGQIVIGPVEGAGAYPDVTIIGGWMSNSAGVGDTGVRLRRCRNVTIMGLATAAHQAGAYYIGTEVTASYIRPGYSADAIVFAGSPGRIEYVDPASGLHHFPLLGLVDGMATPGTVSGVAQPHVAVSDGDLKIVYGDGTLKLIVADT